MGFSLGLQFRFFSDGNVFRLAKGTSSEASRCTAIVEFDIDRRLTYHIEQSMSRRSACLRPIGFGSRVNGEGSRMDLLEAGAWERGGGGGEGRGAVGGGGGGRGGGGGQWRTSLLEKGTATISVLHISGIKLHQNT